ncbi:esterase-like protein [Colletotrichum incanum]|uniref:Esterase-like protein n=1 Tax=Colletotrichum incanum TaxID=1573173 RepID=A0A167BRR1_COLIC|nr:esterase-like protein [Colletotrichum incanum]
MHERNPLQVQFAPPNQRQRRLPLVLIHDGGGTSFTYFLLESLHRDVWAIHNPHYQTGEAWPGGMVQMARHYIGLMLMAGLSGPVMLGVPHLYIAGWSLGGLLALSISQILARRPLSRLSVAGLLIIDSPHHTPWSELTLATSKPDLGNIPELVQKSFDNCQGLLNTWKLLPWDRDACNGRDVCVAVGGEKFRLRGGEFIYKPAQGRWRTMKTRGFDRVRTSSRQPISPPPGVLIKCVQHVPAKGSTSYPVQVDLCRDEPLLGWEGNHVEFIKAVIEADAHHFNIFQFSNVSTGLIDCFVFLRIMTIS